MEQPQTALQSISREEQTQLAVLDQDSTFVNWLDTRRFEHVQRIAKVFAESNLVPAQYKGKIADCIIGVQMAFRLNVDPFMFLQKTCVVSGKPGMEAQLKIGLVNVRGPFEGPIQCRFSGTKGQDDWTCTAFAKHKITGEMCEYALDWATVKREGWLDKSGSKWKTIPEKMMIYRAKSWLIDVYCPEVTLGLLTVEELHDANIVDVTPIKANDSPGAPPRADLSAFAVEDDPDVSATLDESPKTDPKPSAETTEKADKVPGRKKKPEELDEATQKAATLFGAD